MKKYIYTTKNLLEYPHKYQYSKYEGNTLFDKFKDDRNNAIEILNNNINLMNNEKEIDVNLDIREYIQDENIKLQEFLVFIYSCNKQEYLNRKDILCKLIQRFEVGKKLYETYDLEHIKKSSIKFNNLLNYPLFSLVLQKYFHQETPEQQLIYFNAILKVNDIISSAINDFTSHKDMHYCIKSFQGELDILGLYND